MLVIWSDKNNENIIEIWDDNEMGDRPNMINIW